jgi:hypothetical protein
MAEVDDMWERYPIGNVGLVLGSIIRIDVDGDPAYELLQALSGGDLPATWTFYTPAGPHPQYLYACPEGRERVRTGKQNTREGHNELAILALGSLTVVPPSRHPGGGVYTWKPGFSPDDIPIATAPEWLMQYAENKQTRRGAAAISLSGGMQSSDVDALRVTDEIKRLIREGAPQGKRSEALAKVYLAMHQGGHSADETAAALSQPGSARTALAWASSP